MRLTVRAGAWLFVTVGVMGAAFAQGTETDEVRAALESAARQLHDGEYRRVLQTLASVEPREPDNPWLLFYKGAAHLELGQAYDAMACFDRALAVLIESGDPEPQLSETIRLRRKTARQQVFSLSAQIGLAYDSNVSFLGGGASDLGLVSGRGDGRFVSGARLDYAPIADENQTLAVGVRLAHAWQFSIAEFNDQEYGADLRYSRRIADDLDASLQYRYGLALLDNDPFLSENVLSPSVTYHWEASPQPLRLDSTRLYYEFDAANYRFPTRPIFNQDGLSHGFGVEQGIKLRPLHDRAWTWDLNLGYRITQVGTQGREFDRLAHDFFVGVVVPLVNPLLPQKELTFRCEASWRLDDYRHASLFDSDGDARRDLISGLGFVLSQKVFEDPEGGDLTVHAIVHLTEADSNIRTQTRATPFSYDKAVYGIQLEWSW